MLIGKEATNNPIEMVMLATPTKAGPNNTNLAFRSPTFSNMHLNNDDDNSEQELSHQNDDLNSPIAILFQDKPRKSRFNFTSPRVRKSPRKKQPSPAITSITSIASPLPVQQEKKRRTWRRKSDRMPLSPSLTTATTTNTTFDTVRSTECDMTTNETMNLLVKEVHKKGDREEIGMIREAMIEFLADTATANNDRFTEVFNAMMANESKPAQKKKMLRDIGNYLLKNTDSPDSIDIGNKLLVALPKPRDTITSSDLKEWAKKKSKVLRKLLNNLLGDRREECEDEVLYHLTKKAKSKNKFMISSLEMLVVRNKAGDKVSHTTTYNFCKYIEDLLKNKGVIEKNERIFEGQMRKKLGALESASAVPIKTLLLQCQSGKDETGTCLYYYIENVPLLLERMNSGCSIRGKFLNSNKVSSLENVAIIKYGADRGMSDLIMQVSLGNRKDGNHGKYAIPIGVVEGAMETYSNLANTFYSPKRKMRTLLEQLINDELFMIRLCFNNENTSTLRDMKCIIMHFCGISRKELEKKRITCTIDDDLIIATNFTEEIEWTSTATDRDEVDDVNIDSRMLSTLVIVDTDTDTDVSSNSELSLRIRLVQFEDEFVGCKIFSTKTEEEIFSFKFDIGVSCAESSHSTISANCLQIWGKPCEDGKMQATVHGLSTCGASYPCPICTWNIYEDVVPSWVKESGNDDIRNIVCKDCEVRLGYNSLEQSHQDFKTRRGGRTGSIPIEMKKDAFSVVHEPLLRIEDDKKYKCCVDELHARQGMMTHLTTETSVQLGNVELDDENDFTDTLVANIEEYIAETNEIPNNELYKQKKKELKNADKEVEKAYEMYIDATKNIAHRDEIEQLRTDFEDLAADRGSMNNEPGSFIQMNKIVNGAEELADLLKGFKKSKKKNSFNKVVFIFIKSLKMFAGDIYKGHGVSELTGMQGMRALKHRQEIYELVVSSSNNDEQVVAIMQWWLECADLLYPLSCIMKSQEKLSDEKLKQFKDLLADYVKKWTTQLESYTNKNPVFWKLHMVLCGLVWFAEETRMIGLCTTENFENKHYVMSQIKKLMQPIALDVLRCEKMSHRQQYFMISGVEDIEKIFDEEDKKRGKGKKRGQYKSKGTRTKIMQDLPIEELVQEEAIADHFVSSEGNFIPARLSDEYAFMLHGKVPDDWIQSFQDSNSLGTKAVSTLQYAPMNK